MKNKMYFLLVITFMFSTYIICFSQYLPFEDLHCNEDYWVEQVEKSPMKIIASSSLAPSGKYNYKPENLLDKKVETCWCPDGKRKFEFVILKIPKNIRGFKIINGCAVNKKIFYSNNRVKKIYWETIAERYWENKELDDADQCFNGKKYVKLKYHGVSSSSPILEKAITLKDTMSHQLILFSDSKYFSWNKTIYQKSKNVYLFIAIMDIYKENKFNDTCISEIQIVK